MKKFQFTTFFSLQLLLLMVFFQLPVFAADYSDNISEEYLRSQFTFAAGDKLKYAECTKKSHPTCTYIWGAEHKKDAARLNAGVAPKGNKLQIVYAQARSKKDFDRVLGTYKDTKKVEGIGAEAVWSEKRKQLSLITEKNLIVHIHIDEKGGDAPEEKAISIAKDLFGNQ